MDALHQAQLSEQDKAELAAVRQEARAREGQEVEKWDVKESVHHALDHCTARKSVVKDYEVMAEALRHSRGHITAESIQNYLKYLRTEGVILQRRNDLATEQSLQREKQMIWLVNQGVGKFERLARGKEFIHAKNDDGTDKLNASQKVAVNYLLSSRDYIINLRGAAGVGKTHSLSEVYRGLKEAGRDVIAIAPTKNAVQEMQDVGIEEKRTFSLQGLLKDKLAGEKIRNKVVMLDEAAMVDATQMFELLRIGKESGARFISSGDTRQLQPISAGDALRILETKSSLRTHDLTEIVRQKDPVYRYAMELMRQDPREAFDLLDAMGAIKEVPACDRPAAIANELKQKPGALVVGLSHAENDRINDALRAGGESHKLRRMHSLGWTEPERKNIRNYEPGHVLLFHKPTANGKLDDAYRVTGTRERWIETENLQGQKVLFSQKQARAFNVFEQKEFEASVGDTVIFSANCKRERFECVNGHRAEITAFDEKGRPVLNTGQSVPQNFFQFSLGYSITVHKSQSKTTDHVISSANALNWEQAYVAWSRARGSLTIYTSNKEELREAIAHSGKRLSALDLEEQINNDASEPLTASKGKTERALEEAEIYQRRKLAYQAAESYRDSINVGMEREEDQSSRQPYTYSGWQNHERKSLEQGMEGR